MAGTQVIAETERSPTGGCELGLFDDDPSNITIIRMRCRADEATSHLRNITVDRVKNSSGHNGVTSDSYSLYTL